MSTVAPEIARENRALGLKLALIVPVMLLFCASLVPLYRVICEQLGAAGLNGPQVRVVLEKPLGEDLASAQEINRVVGASFREHQALRIDHYLGKPAVQNLMALRFANALFEPLWRRESIANIQITLAESLGVGTRGDFYDRTGALRDMVQNHALQLLTMVAMEPPSSNDADAIRDEKLKVLRSLKPFTPESVARDAQIVVNFRPAPHSIFPGVHQPNKLVIKLQPEDGLELHLLAAKGAGTSDTLAPVFLDLDFDKAFAENRVGAYERLLLDAIAGRLNLFVRSDEQEQAWRWVEPVLDAWAQDGTGPRPYAAGTWGPAAASALVARDGFAWAEEQ